MELREGYKNSEVGVVPEDWEVKAIDQDIDLLTGFPFQSLGYSENGIRLLRCSNVKRGVTDWSEGIVEYWSKITPELKPYILKEGDIVIAMDGSLVGKSFARLTHKDLPALLLQRVARIRSKKVDVGYLKEFVCSDYFTKYCDTVKTSSAIPHISPKDIRGFIIPIPPSIEEQTAIASALSDTDALITALEKLIAKKQAIKQGAMQELLRPKEGWDKSKLHEVCDLITKGTTPTSVGRDFEKEGINFIKIESLTASGRIIKEKVAYIDYYTNNLLKRSQLKSGDLLFSIAGALGRVAIVSVEILPANTNQALAIIRLKKESGLNLKYLFYYLNGRNIQNHILAINVQGAQSNLSLLNIADLKIEHPDVIEQSRIARILSDMDLEIETLEKKLDKYRLLKQGMMQILLTGKIRLKL